MTVPPGNPQLLIEKSQGLVRSLAAKIHCTLPPYLELDDLIAYGQVGLAEAARDFDPDRGTQFSTYAYYRIRGAIYDGLSKMTWLSRAQYKRLRFDQLANEALQVDRERGGESTEGEAIAGMRWFRDISRALAVVYLATQGATEEDSRTITLEDTSMPTPETTVINREINEKLHELIDTLPPEAATLIRATYFEGMTLQEAGKKLGISKSWASRLHAKTLQQLARSLKTIGAAS